MQTEPHDPEIYKLFMGPLEEASMTVRCRRDLTAIELGVSNHEGRVFDMIIAPSMAMLLITKFVETLEELDSESFRAACDGETWGC